MKVVEIMKYILFRTMVRSEPQVQLGLIRIHIKYHGQTPVHFASNKRSCAR
jgi:hypothetical protein